MMDAIESTLSNVGLTTPTRRFIGFGILAGALLYYYKPDSMFFDGYARPWSVTSPYSKQAPDDGSSIPPTSLPWWLAAALVGLGAALFL
jgi:hypothetical protein